MLVKRHFITLLIAVLSTVAFATSALAVGIMPSFAGVPAGWTTDRYEPASFSNVGAFQGRPASLGISIDSTGNSANRPSGQQGTFYNTQGRQFSFSPFAGPGSVLSSDLYIPASWAIATNGSRRTDMWGVMVDGSNAISSFPIIGFTNYGGAPRFRVWDDSGAGAWIDLGTTVNYDAWNHFSIELLADTSIKFYANGALVYTQTNTGSSVAFSAVIMQAYNFADPLIVPAGVPNDYTANWANSVLIVDTDGQASANDCSASEAALSTIQSAINAAGPGDDIKVCPGTYIESPQINKSLTLESTGGRDVTTIQLLPNGSPGTGYLAGVYINSATADVVLDGFTIAGNDAADPVLANSNVVIQTAKSVTVTNSRLKVGAIDGGSNGDDGIGILTTYASGAGPVSVTNSEFVPVNTSGGRAFYINPAVGNTFSFQNNQVSGHFAYNAATECGGSVSNNTITGTGASGGFGASNFGGPACGDPGPFTNNSVTGAATGIRIRGANNTVLSGNSFTGNGIGIWFDTDNVTGTIAHFNRIANNTTAGITNDTASIVDAENNWWGCNYGPGASGAGCPVAANGITGPGAANVDANPWLVMTTAPTAPSTIVNVPIDVYTNLWKNSDGGTPAGGFVRDGTPSLWATDFGSLTPQLVTTIGQTGTFINSPTPGVANVSTTIDGQTVSTPVAIYPASCAAVSMPIQNTLTNQSIVVPVNTDEMTARGAISVDATLTFNSSVLSLPLGSSDANNWGVTLGTVGTSNGGPRELTVTHPSANTLVISIFGASEFQGSGALVNLNFKVTGLPATSSTMGFGSFTYNEGTPCSGTTNGAVNVLSGTISGTVSYGNVVGSPIAPRHVPGVTLNATGSIPVSTNTATNGTYSLSGMGAGAYDVTPSKTGGVNGAISGFDASYIATYVVGIGPGNTINAAQQSVADVSGNGSITSYDAALIARYVASLPGSGTTGTWRFEPTQIHYASVNINYTAQDYAAKLMGDVTGNWFDPSATFREPVVFTGKPLMVTAPNLSAPVSSEVSVPITVQDTTGKGILSYQFDLRYDPKVLEPATVPTDLVGTISEGYNVTVNPLEPGVLRVVAFGVQPLAGGGQLLNLRFNVVGSVDSSSDLIWENIGLNEGNIYFQTVNGRVQVTAASNNASINGRVLTSTGQGVANARVTITDTNGQVRNAITGGFGMFQFGDLQVGQTYTIRVTSKRYTFAPQTVSVTGDAVSVDLIAQP